MLSVLALFLVLAISVVSANNNPPSCNDNQGSIWTTRSDCGTEQQDENQYAIGEKVYIRGEGFCPGDYDWDITGQPGQASCDSNSVVISGNRTVDSSGNFCFEAYTVNSNDCGVYHAEFGNKGDNYHVSNTPLIPEFGLTIGILTIVGAVGTFFLIRKQ